MSTTYGFIFAASTGEPYAAAESYVAKGDVYPVSYSNGASGGYTGAIQPDSINESQDIDYRLSHTHYSHSNSQVCTFKVGTTGSIVVNSANGDHGNGSSACYSVFKDNGTTIATVTAGTGQSSNQWWDASGVLRTTAALWVSNQTSITGTFNTSFEWVLGNASAGGASYWNYLSIVVTAGGGSTERFPLIPEAMNFRQLTGVY